MRPHRLFAPCLLAAALLASPAARAWSPSWDMVWHWDPHSPDPSQDVTPLHVTVPDSAIVCIGGAMVGERWAEGTAYDVMIRPGTFEVRVQPEYGAMIIDSFNVGGGADTLQVAVERAPDLSGRWAGVMGETVCGFRFHGAPILDFTCDRFAVMDGGVIGKSLDAIDNLYIHNVSYQPQRNVFRMHYVKGERDGSDTERTLTLQLVDGTKLVGDSDLPGADPDAEQAEGREAMLLEWEGPN